MYLFQVLPCRLLWTLDQLLLQLLLLSSALQTTTTATALALQTTATACFTMYCPMFCLSSSLHSGRSYLGRVCLRLMRCHEALMFLPSHSFTAHCSVVFLCKRMRLRTTQLGKEKHITSSALVELIDSVQFLWVFANHQECLPITLWFAKSFCNPAFRFHFFGWREKTAQQQCCFCFSHSFIAHNHCEELLHPCC